MAELAAAAEALRIHEASLKAEIKVLAEGLKRSIGEQANAALAAAMKQVADTYPEAAETVAGKKRARKSSSAGGSSKRRGASFNAPPPTSGPERSTAVHATTANVIDVDAITFPAGDSRNLSSSSGKATAAGSTHTAHTMSTAAAPEAVYDDDDDATDTDDDSEHRQQLHQQQPAAAAAAAARPQPVAAQQQHAATAAAVAASQQPAAAAAALQQQPVAAARKSTSKSKSKRSPSKVAAKKSKSDKRKEQEMRTYPLPAVHRPVRAYPADFGANYKGRFIKMRFDDPETGCAMWDVGRLHTVEEAKKQLYWVWFYYTDVDGLSLEQTMRKVPLTQQMYTTDHQRPLGSWYMLE
jgi:hypothetical protein